VTIITHVPTTRVIPAKDVYTPLFRATMRMNVPLTNAIPPADVLIYPSRVTIVICAPPTPVHLALDVRTPRSVATITTPALMIIVNATQAVPMSLLLHLIVTMVMSVPMITAIRAKDVITQPLGVNAMMQMPARMIAVTRYLVA